MVVWVENWCALVGRCQILGGTHCFKIIAAVCSLGT